MSGVAEEMLEALRENTTALRENTAARAAGGGASSTAGSTTGKPRGRPPANKVKLDDVKIIGARVQTEKGQDVAVGIVKQFGVGRLADMKEEDYAAFIAACEVVLNEPDEPQEAGPVEL